MGSDWRECRLRDVADIQHVFAFPGQYFRDEPPGDILLTPGNFMSGGGYQDGRAKYYVGPVPEEFVLAPDDLLVTMTDLSKDSDTLGYPALIPNDPSRRFLHNQRLGKILLRPGVDVDRGFLYYLLCTRQYRAEVLAGATGTTVKHTSPSRLGEFAFRIPPPAEQRRIAGMLRALDDKIELNRRMSQTLESIARALFKSWFVDFDPVRAKAESHDPGLASQVADLFPSSFENSELGEIPAGWRAATIGSIADVVDCSHAKKPERRENGRPMLQLGNIRQDGVLDMADEYFISDSDYRAWTARIEASPGDCVITNVGRVGAVAQVPNDVRAALGRNMTAVRCRSDKPWPTFLVEALRSDSMRDEIVEKTDAGTILDALNVRSIPRLRVVEPRVPVLDCFEAAARPLRAKMESIERESRHLQVLRDAMLPSLLQGDRLVVEWNGRSGQAAIAASRD
jgi:type I restriction enzyme S subunit